MATTLGAKVQPGIFLVGGDLVSDDVAALVVLKSSGIDNISNRGGYNYVSSDDEGNVFTCKRPNPLNNASNESFGGPTLIPCDYLTPEEAVAAYAASEFRVAAN